MRVIGKLFPIIMKMEQCATEGHTVVVVVVARLISSSFPIAALAMMKYDGESRK